MAELERIKQEIRDEYELQGTVWARAWLDSYPEHRVELEHFIRELTDSLNLDTPPTNWADGGALVARLIQSRMDTRREHLDALRLREEIERARTTARPEIGARTERKLTGAALVNWMVSVAFRVRSLVTRKDVQKLVYLVQTACSIRLIRDFVPLHQGPFSLALIQEGERYGQDREWLDVYERYKYRLGPRIKDAELRAKGYLGETAAVEHLIEFLTRFSTEQLEVLATVHWLAQPLVQQGATVNVDSVVDALDAHPKWSGKRSKPYFADAEILASLHTLTDLGLLPTNRVDAGSDQ